MKLQVAEVMRELERAWEAGSLPGRQAADHNAAQRELHRLLDRERQPATDRR
jgi:hypothetical protein